MTPAVFLDRDGVVVEECGYLRRAEDVRLLPGAAQAIARLNRAGIPVVVVTNQSAVARGMCSEADVQTIHGVLGRMLEAAGATVQGFYYCPHHPTEGTGAYRRACTCRKPEPGLLLQAADDLALDLKRSMMVGDKLSDLEAGWHAGCRSLLVLTGYGEATQRELAAGARQPVDVAPDLDRAVAWILGRSTPVEAGA